MAFSSSISTATSRFLARRPFLQNVIHHGCGGRLGHKQHTPQSVLSFFFGVNYNDPSDVQKNLVSGFCLDSEASDMPGLWFAGGAEYDALCRDTFSETIRQVAGGHEQQSLRGTADWESTIDGCVARMILCDQIARNAFRATPEAFAYEKPALDVARQLAAHHFALSTATTSSSRPASLEGEIHPPYLSFIVTALMHSESVDDHDGALQVLKQAKQEASLSSSRNHLQSWWDYQLSFEMEHKKVIDTFGRYPHRNKLKGRASTSAEEAWLADTENLPSWAKSQGS
jgi:uncharacterized protein (DUF924 family)